MRPSPLDSWLGPMPLPDFDFGAWMKALVERPRIPLWLHISRLLPDPNDVDDVLANTFAVVYRERSTVADLQPGQIEQWIWTTATRLGITKRRQKRVQEARLEKAAQEK